MKFEIRFTMPDGNEDMIIIEGNTIEEIRNKAISEVEKRKGTNVYSREIT